MYEQKNKTTKKKEKKKLVLSDSLTKVKPNFKANLNTEYIRTVNSIQVEKKCAIYMNLHAIILKAILFRLNEYQLNKFNYDKKKKKHFFFFFQKYSFYSV